MNNKLIINTNLLRKEAEFKTKSCAVEKAIAVSHAEFDNLKRHPLQDNDLIAENTDLMYCDRDDIYHCLLIYDEEQGDGLLIEAEGSSYARYVQYIPNAKLLYENHIQTHLQEMKFYCPLEISRVPECWSDEEYEKISSYEASAYKSEINHFISDFNLPEEKERGLMHWYDRGNSVDRKVFSAFMSVEEHNGELVGVVTANVHGQLTEDELEDQQVQKHYEQIAPTIYALTAAIDAKDSYTFEHSCHVSDYAVLLAKKIGLEPNDIEIVKEAGLLHDIGKIGIPESILKKQGRLNDEEYEIMKTHVTNSIEMIHFLPNMNYVIPAVLSHHERYDGKGYPRGLKGEDIPLLGRILAVCDSFDAMTTKRTYKEAMSIDYAIGELERNKGTQFDPKLAETFIELLKEGKIDV